MRFSKRILIALNVVLICALAPVGDLKAWVSDPLCVTMTTVQPVVVKMTAPNTAKVQSGKWSFKLGTPSLGGCYTPAITTAPMSISLSNVTVARGGSTKTNTMVNIPGLKIVQKSNWPSNNSKVRIRLIIERGSIKKTRTFWRKPDP